MSFPKVRTLAMATLGTLLAAGIAMAEPVGFIATAINDVQVQKYGTTSWEAAIQDADVSVGDTIRTGFDSQAKIILVDDTTLSIDEDTEITIQSLHVGAAATQDRSIIRQTRGRLRTVVGSAFGGQTRLEVHTPTAVVGVKGTDLTSEKDEESRITGNDKEKGQWLFCLVDGKIEIRTPAGLGIPKPGNCIYAYDTGELSDELPNPANAFEVSFSTPNFAPPDFVTPETPAVGEGPPGGGLESIDPPVEPEISGGDELGVTSQTTQEDVMTMEEPPPPIEPDIIGF